MDTLVLFPLIDAADRNEEGRRARVLEGTRRSLEAAAGAATVVLWSSGVVYGAHPDNPVPIPETQPTRPNPEFPAAGILAESERVALEAFPDDGRHGPRWWCCAGPGCGRRPGGPSWPGA